MASAESSIPTILVDRMKKDHLKRTKMDVMVPIRKRKRHALIVISDQKLQGFKSSMEMNKDHL